MSRNERHIIVWGEDRRRSPAPHQYETGSVTGGSAVVGGMRRGDRVRTHPELLRRLDVLTEENTHLRAEILELRRMNQDLEASAEIWATLFERQVARTKQLEAELKGKKNEER